MMNELIKELVRESHLDVYGLGKGRYKWEYTVEKFAELIIRQAHEIIVVGGVDDVDDVLKYFGVE